MQAILSDMRAAFRNLADDGPSMVVLLVIGYVIAWVVTFAATIALVMLFFGSGGSLPLWLAYIPGLLGGAFMVVTIGSIARSMVTMESGDDSRSRAWGAIPLVVLMSGIGAVVAAAMPMAGVPLAVVGGWVTMLAMLDIMLNDSPLGLAAAWEVLRTEPVRNIGAMAVTLALALGVSFAPVPPILLAPLLLVFEMAWGCEIYRSVMPDPVAAMRVEEVSAAEQQRDGRRASFLKPADEVTADAATPASASAAVSPIAPHVPTGSAWAGAALATEYGSGAGAWVVLPEGCTLLEVSTAPLPASRVLVVSSEGERFDLPQVAEGSWRALLPSTGSWFLAVEGAGVGCTVQWQSLPGSAPEMGAAA